MKRVIFASLLFPFMMSCNQGVKKENAQLKSENEELAIENRQKDSLINAFVEDFSTIQENLATIREKEESIQSAREQGLEKSPNLREEVIRDVEAINELLSENRKTIANLNDKVKRYSYEVGKFKKLVANLNSEIEAKDNQVVELKENLATMNFQMERLNAKLDTATVQNRQQRERIEQQTEALNTAYYAVGTYDDLNENKVVVKEGGVIGLGATKALAQDFNKDYFTKIDIRNTTVIPLNVDDDDVKLISTHPSDSYKWNKVDDKVGSLEITNPEKFWKSSKYLVVLVD
ncbi:MAG TPA: hypothetical protein DCG19_08380 [Cryomorphaceae bacterium]|nr:hypothetical protein [Owenweeksia sp.]MBF98335.1 hypothetical protein [Owenweeksia sp.]HAD97410.1 hypothetical protein [Cryomorphaceae bacterium]HBF19768.1 hypothetical protein [Cryomorphaceae bacterium]HCQ16560.1 hypothetical protein [Cryomorphaceae bacterium]|tara:strand:- start:13295 stop:14164 length:870 start_codon:yes stop_codon:yes gene_type:complete